MQSLEENNALLLFRVGPVLCCVPSMPVTTIITPPKLTCPPGTSVERPGIFRHANKIATAFDLRYKFGVPEDNWCQNHRVIIADLDKKYLGFVVDEIKEILTFPTTGWGPLPVKLPKGVFSKTLIINNKIYLYADLANLLKISKSGYLKHYIEALLAEEEKAAEKIAVNSQDTNNLSKNTSNKSNQLENNNKASQLHTESITSAKSTDVSQEFKIKSNTEKESYKEHEHLVIQNKMDKEDESKTEKESINTQAQENTLGKNNVTSPITTPTNVHNINKSKLIEKETTRKSKNIEASTIESSEINLSKIDPIKHSTIKNKTETNKLNQSKKHNDLIKIKSNTKSSTTSKYNNYSNISVDKNNDSSNNSMLAMFMSILVISLFIGGYFLWNSLEPKSKIKQTSNSNNTASSKSHVSTYQEDVLPSEEDRNNVLVNHGNELINIHNEPVDSINTDSPSESTQYKTEDTEAADLASNQNNVDDIVKNNELTSVEDISTTNSTNDSETEVNNGEYHASIQRDSEGITITIDSPDGESVLKEPTQDQGHDYNSQQAELAGGGHATTPIEKAQGDTVQPDQTTQHASDTISTSFNSEEDLQTQAADVDTSGSSDTSKTNPTITQTNKSIIQQDINHIVVKGDTLWYISKLYLHNPYRYPELAKLSKIKNPDLIYPGDRVRIIIRTQQ